jgi:predicted 3-demethylubiquinone-9 3-methyltransferase (glyoxalase superfamily)
MQKITPFLWYDGQAEEAAKFYTSLFKNSSADNVNPMITNFQLNGMKFMALNGGPQFKFSNAISLFVTSNNFDEIDLLWQKLSEDGTVLMELNEYPWSKKYGWVNDKFGLSWQLFFGDKDQQIAPTLLFVKEQFGNAEAAIDLYTSLFDTSEKVAVTRFGDAYPGFENNIQFAEFELSGQSFRAMESQMEHNFGFNEAFSFFVSCENQEEVDFFWDQLIANGGEESQCGWLKDKFGISWQVIPKLLMQLMSDKNQEKTSSVMNAMLQMKKIDCQKLQNAYDGK